MTKDVLVSVKGLQYQVSPDEAMEMIASGEYYFRNDKHYVLYEEIMEDNDGDNGISKNTLKVSENIVELIKKGGSDVHMVFEKDKKNLTYYNTPFGSLLIGIFTTSIEVKEETDSLQVKLEYDLEINNSFVSSCDINIKVKSKEQKVFE